MCASVSIWIWSYNLIHPPRWRVWTYVLQTQLTCEFNSMSIYKNYMYVLPWIRSSISFYILGVATVPFYSSVQHITYLIFILWPTMLVIIEGLVQKVIGIDFPLGCGLMDYGTAHRSFQLVVSTIIMILDKGIKSTFHCMILP